MLRNSCDILYLLSPAANYRQHNQENKDNHTKDDCCNFKKDSIFLPQIADNNTFQASPKYGCPDNDNPASFGGSSRSALKFILKNIKKRYKKIPQLLIRFQLQSETVTLIIRLFKLFTQSGDFRISREVFKIVDFIKNIFTVVTAVLIFELSNLQLVLFYDFSTILIEL